MADSLFSTLLNVLKEYIHSEDELTSIEEAYRFALRAHEGQLRRSGEAYISHPVSVSIILGELKVGPTTIKAALLHDVIEDTGITAEEISERFGSDVSSLVEGVTKIGKISFLSHRQADNQQKMLLAMAKDIRVIVIKIADRLHNMRTIDSMPQDARERIAKETLEIYAPLAHRLGIFRIKAELEDRSLRYTNPSMYYTVSDMLQATKDQRETSINSIIGQIEKLFLENHISSFEIKGRIKNIYSIYKKMVHNSKSFEDIYDLLAIRIIVDKIEDCYHILGLIHATFTPIPRRFKDYIAVPKPNLYQSLHTTVLSEEGTLFEVQIRTQEMDDVAENGIAAHWAYKENKVYSREKEQFEIAQKLKWYGELLRMSEDSDEKDSDAEEFVKTIKADILEANVYVFTPKGEVIELPKGATPIDFAYKIHTDVGNKMIGALVNSRIVTLDYELKTGDIVSVKTGKNATGPNESWLKIASSAHARHKIKGYLNQINRESLVNSGKELLDREMELNKITEVPSDAFLKKNFEKNSIINLQTLYFEIGKGLMSPKTIVNKMLGIEQDREQNLARQMEKTSRQLTTLSETGIIVEGLNNPQIKLASCCTPILGDEVIGYISKASGIVVHTEFCPNIKGLDSKRMISVYWAKEITRKYATWLKIIGSNRDNLLTDIINAINAGGVSIAEISAVNTTLVETVIKVKVSLTNIEALSLLFINIKKVSEVYSIERNIK